jgi:hypothetical protein
MRHNQNRRSRGRSGRKGPNPLARSYESNGPDVKVRGTPAHIAEKYMTLARDALSSGDIVAAENYFQHAEHYNRIIAAAQAQAQQAQPDVRARDGGDEDSYEGERHDRQMNGRDVEFGRDERDDRDERGVREDDGQEAPAAQQQEQQAAEPERPRRRRRPRGEEGAEAPAPRRRGERSASAANGAGEGEDDTTHDGQAALAAFPD